MRKYGTGTVQEKPTPSGGIKSQHIIEERVAINSLNIYYLVSLID